MNFLEGFNFQILTILVDNFLGQCQMVLCTIAFCIVKDDRQTVARALAQFHIALDYGFEYQLLEMSLYLIVNLVG